MDLPAQIHPPAWIGIDWGSSAFRVWRVRVAERQPPLLATSGSAVERKWPLHRFTAVTLEEQLLEHEAGGMSLTEAERREGRDRVGMVAHGVKRAIEAQPANEHERLVRVAIAAPGLRVKGGAGLALVRNGPRIPDLCARLEERIGSQLGFSFDQLSRIVPDGLACAMGERVAEQGRLRDVDRAYSLAGGSGLAEAFVIDGRPRALDNLQGVQKAWEARTDTGECFEDLLAPMRLNARYARLAGLRTPLAGDDRPEVRAERGDAGARDFLSVVARAFGQLVERRAAEVAGLERVVVGQSLGAMMAPDTGDWFRDRMTEELAARTSIELHVSQLRAAPALGAVALQLEQEGGGSATS